MLIEESELLAHLSRRFIGELIVLAVIRRPSSSTFFNISSEADSSHISHIASTGRGNELDFFCPNWIRTLVAMATYSCH